MLKAFKKTLDDGAFSFVIGNKFLPLNFHLNIKLKALLLVLSTFMFLPYLNFVFVCNAICFGIVKVFISFLFRLTYLKFLFKTFDISINLTFWAWWEWVVSDIYSLASLVANPT